MMIPVQENQRLLPENNKASVSCKSKRTTLCIILHENLSRNSFNAFRLLLTQLQLSAE